MRSLKKLKSKMILGVAIALSFFTFVLLAAFLLGPKEWHTFFASRLPQAILRISLGVLIYSTFASLLISYLDQKGFSRENWKRWMIESLSILVFSALLASIEFIAFKYQLERFENVPGDPRIFSTMFNTLMAIIITAVYEVWTVLEQNQQLQTSLAKSEKDILESQLVALQQKLNPHFLFNSLNVLSELIYEDTSKSDKFIKEFSNIYRYLLDLNDKPLVTIKEELKFLNSYLFLQKIRFEESLNVEIDLDRALEEDLIPPLSLQLLFENALKHNRISKAEPLSIKLEAKNGFLIVSNSLQLRSDVKDSKGTGQTNLTSQYSILSDQSPEFLQKGNLYVSKIPILKKLS